MYLQTVSNQICRSQNIQSMVNDLNKPLFLHACSADFLKHSGKRRNCFATSNFLIFLHCFLPFSRTFRHFHHTIPKIVVCKLFNLFSNKPWVYMSAVQVFENTVRKGEIACIEQFLLFLHCFLPFNRTFNHFFSFSHVFKRLLFQGS